MSDASEQDLFAMTNLYRARTGLPMTVWAGPRDNARHAPRIRANVVHGDRMDVHNTAVVGIEPAPHMIAGHLSKADQDAVFAWVDANRDALLEHWNGAIDGGDMALRTVRVP